MFKFAITIVLLCFNYLGLKAQALTELSAEIKMLLFTSVEYDGHAATNGTLKNWIEVRENHYNFLQVEQSPLIVLYKPQMLDSISGKYDLILYKILCQNSENQSRFVLRYKDISSEVWLRVGGYVENDLHLLFNYLKDYGIKRENKTNYTRVGKPEFIVC